MVRFPIFATTVLAQTAAFVGLTFWLLPQVAKAESHMWLGIIIWAAILGIPLSLFEYLYHRYLLHAAVLPFMSSMHRAHTTHHGLTNVQAPVTPRDPEKMVTVTSAYPVEEEHQEESMMFPLYSIAIFQAIFLILLALPFKLMFPSQPILFATMLSVMLCYSLYEFWHAILHLPFETFWKPATEEWAGKRMFRRMYSFHLMHHWRPTCNLAIVGLWGVAVWDYAFLTHRRPERIPLDQASVNFTDCTLRKPLFVIQLFDRWKSGMYKGSRAVERFLARVFLGRKSA
jgi:hemolysin III